MELEPKDVAPDFASMSFKQRWQWMLAHSSARWTLRFPRWSLLVGVIIVGFGLGLFAGIHGIIDAGSVRRADVIWAIWAPLWFAAAFGLPVAFGLYANGLRDAQLAVLRATRALPASLMERMGRIGTSAVLLVGGWMVTSGSLNTFPRVLLVALAASVVTFPVLTFIGRYSRT